MKLLGERSYFHESEHDVVAGMSWNEWEIAMTTLAAYYWTPEWAAAFRACIDSLEIDTATRNGLCLGLDKGDGMFQREDGNLYSFADWAAAVLLNFKRHGDDGKTRHPFVYSMNRIGDKRYRDLMDALRNYDD